MKRITNILVVNLIIIFEIGIISSFNYYAIAVSNDTGVKSLTVTPIIGELKQDEENNKIYRTKVENNITEVNVNVVPNNNNAKVEILGNTYLQIGTNKVTVKVTAENGDNDTYIIYVRRSDTPIAEEEIISNVQEEKEEEKKEENTTQTNQTNQEENNTKTEIVEDKSEENVISQPENEMNETNEIDESEKQTKKPNTNILPYVLVTLLIIVILTVIVLYKKKIRRK